MDYHFCKKCKTNRSINNFYFDKKTKKLYTTCKICKQKYRSEHKEHTKQYQEQYRIQNKEKILKRDCNYYYNHYEHYQNQRNLKKEAIKIYNKNYQQNNKHIMNAKAAKRRAAELKATPKWLTKQQLNEIKELYKLAQELKWLSEDILSIDHIIPLQGKNVCGLHVPWNLQILPKSLNSKKKNNYGI